MNFERLLGAIGAECPAHLYGKQVSCIVTNPNKARKNCIFVCISNSRYGSAEHIDEALKAGAGVVVAENVRGSSEGGAALTFVDNTRMCASLLYNEWYERPARTENMKIIGVTGTNGKTSVTCMLREIFEKAGYSCGQIGTLGIFSKGRRLGGGELSNANMTTPDPETLYSALAQMRDDGVEYVFMEVSSHGLSQCRTDAITFDCAVFTNLSPEHLDFHKDMESYYKAKEKLFSQCRRAVVNTDDTAGRRIARFLEQNGIEFFTCSRSEGDFCAVTGKEAKSSKTEYLLKAPNGTYEVSLPYLTGDFQIMNSLEAAAVAVSCGIPASVAVSALKNMKSIRGRMESVVCGDKQNFRIFIDYAHTPDALEKLLLSARALREKDGGGKIITLFGCGGERDRSKRKIMGQIASRLSDTVIVTSDNSRGEDPKRIINEILKGIDKEKEFAVIEDRASAIETAVSSYARKGDILLLTGKGHECYNIDDKGVHPFDEREIIRKAFLKFYG